MIAVMTLTIPPVADIRSELASMNGWQLERLAQLSGVPRTTIAKIRSGETTNPGLETVRAFLPHLDRARRATGRHP